MTDKRRHFLELLGQGWSVRSACKKLGISRSSGNRWKNGWLERQKDGTVKFVPPLDPLAARTISPRFLSETERIQIADLASRGLGPTAIGGRSAGRRRRSAENCVATCTSLASIDRFTRTLPQQRGGAAVAR